MFGYLVSAEESEVISLEDAAIIELFWNRSEEAIEKTDEKYGHYCRAIAQNILLNHEDSEECVNDTYLAAWNLMPDERPQFLKGFLGKITRNISLKRLRSRLAKKRGGTAVELTLDELQECIPAGSSTQDYVELRILAQLIDSFLRELPQTERNIFLCRYWYFDSIADIAAQFGFGESKVKMQLLRTRKKLKALLEREGIEV